MVTAQQMGKKGGQAKSLVKAAAARKNASKPRGKWVTWANFGVIGADGQEHHGHLLWFKNFDFSEKNGSELQGAMTDFFKERGQKHVLPFAEVIEMSASSRKIDGWKLPSIQEVMSARYGA